MSRTRVCYVPVVTYPDVVPDDAVLAAIDFARALPCRLHVTAFSVDVPHIASPLGDLLIDIPDMIRTVEVRSAHDCRRIQELVVGRVEGLVEAEFSIQPQSGYPGFAAAREARYFDLSLLPWAKGATSVQQVAQTVVFESGRPAIIVPPGAKSEPLNHVTIAWDGSRVAARALSDVMPWLSDETRLTVLTVVDEKPLDRKDLAGTLVTHLQKQGIDADYRECSLSGRTISGALQETAIEAGANLLVMGGFGHSRVRDFVLGGATLGVFADLRLPVLLSH
ncbi:universal stress protein [Rhizobium sp. RU36D]|uniref:universal stress protein n=1 Tax=Rhizobium sp. RU36D TaxID=1907415 RepID=UPI0009D8ABD0|nr:universal stress protein [Rhizobium sp. RU36D]SMC39207.1 Nucleotide-binding universal stress protein, UspA family [Rhizobium sp. RU36D]